MSVRSSSSSVNNAIDFIFPLIRLEVVFVRLQIVILEVDEMVLEVGADLGCLSNTVRVARSILGFPISDSISLPTEFLGESVIVNGIGLSGDLFDSSGSISVLDVDGSPIQKLVDRKSEGSASFVGSGDDLEGKGSTAGAGI